MSTVERFLARYVRLRKSIDFCCGVCWAGLIGVGLWKIPVHAVWFRSMGGGLILVMLIWTGWRLVYRSSPVEAARQIERIDPAFDEKLITLASAQTGGALVDQLRVEIENILSCRTAMRYVPWRRLVVPVAFLATVLGLILAIHLAQ